MKLTEHKKERLCYILEELFNYLITILVSGVNGSYIAKITDYLGFSDSLTAILSAFVTLGYSAQILAGMFFRRGKVKKRKNRTENFCPALPFYYYCICRPRGQP